MRSSWNLQHAASVSSKPRFTDNRQSIPFCIKCQHFFQLLETVYRCNTSLTPQCSLIRKHQKYQLDSMRWFSHRLRTGRRHSRTLLAATKWARPLLLYAACTLQRAHTICMHPGVSAALRAFFVPGDLDPWPWYSNSGEIFVQCT